MKELVRDWGVLVHRHRRMGRLSFVFDDVMVRMLPGAISGRGTRAGRDG